MRALLVLHELLILALVDCLAEAGMHVAALLSGFYILSQDDWLDCNNVKVLSTLNLHSHDFAKPRLSPQSMQTVRDAFTVIVEENV